MTELKTVTYKDFANGSVYALSTEDGYPIETTDTFLPMVTLEAAKRGTNALTVPDFGSRRERWMIGVSVMSGCPVRCPFCATGVLHRWRNLSAEEIMAQAEFIVRKNEGRIKPEEAKEFRILFTRMGEPVFNRREVLRAIVLIKDRWPNTTVALSTIGPRAGMEEFFHEVKKMVTRYGNDFIQLQFSVHSTDEVQRAYLQPIAKYDLRELGKFCADWKTISHRRITLNFTLCNDNEFDDKKIREIFAPNEIFIKLSPLNENATSRKNSLSGLITAKNLA